MKSLFFKERFTKEILKNKKSANFLMFFIDYTSKFVINTPILTKLPKNTDETAIIYANLSLFKKDSPK
jgi:hypothetical protein